MTVLPALPSGTESPRAGSRTFARSHGNLHCAVRWRNCLTPKSRSWFWETESVAGVRMVPWSLTRQRGETYSDTGDVGSNCIEDGDHMAAY